MKGMFNFKRMKSDDLIEGLRLYIEGMHKRIDRLEAQVREFNKDEEIEKLNKEIDRLRVNSLHIFSEKEKLEAKEFSNEHYKKCKSNSSYSIEGTGIGSVVTIRCLKCDKSKNITDTDNW